MAMLSPAATADVHAAVAAAAEAVAARPLRWQLPRRVGRRGRRTRRNYPNGLKCSLAASGKIRTACTGLGSEATIPEPRSPGRLPPPPSYRSPAARWTPPPTPPRLCTDPPCPRNATESPGGGQGHPGPRRPACARGRRRHRRRPLHVAAAVAAATRRARGSCRRPIRCPH